MAKFTKIQERTNIRCLQYLEFVNFGYIFAIPVMVDYISNNGGNGAEGYFFLATIANIVGIVFAVIAGGYSDFYSRKQMMIFSTVCKSCGWLLFAFFPHYASFLTGFLLFIIGNITCNTSACLYETLQASGNDDKYRSLEQTLHAYPQYILMIGLPIAGYLYSIEPAIPFIFNIMISIIGIYVAFLYTEAPRKKTDHHSIVAFLKDTVRFLKNNNRLRWITLFGGSTQAVTWISIFVFQAAFLELGGSITSFSIAIIGIYLCRAFGAQQPTRLFKTIPNQSYALAFILITGSLFMALSGFTQALSLFVPCMMIYMLIRGMQNPSFNFVYNDLLTSDIRATAFGAQNFVTRISLIAFNFTAGFGIATVGALNTLTLLACFILLCAGSFLFLFEKQVNSTNNA